MTLSPITQRRLRQFKANKRGYWSSGYSYFFSFYVLVQNFWPMTNRFWCVMTGRFICPFSKAMQKRNLAVISRRAEYRDPFILI